MEKTLYCAIQEPHYPRGKVRTYRRHPLGRRVAQKAVFVALRGIERGITLP
jgi:hypothetical protein